MIKKIFWLRYLSVFLVFTPLLSVSFTQVSAAQPIHVAQAQSAYNQYMRQGYAATSQRNYTRALGFFQQALGVRPGDRFAIAAINNVKSYINRRKRPDSLSFNVGQPGRRTPGATRGTNGCLQVETQQDKLTPLVPTDKEPQITTSKNPTLFFYVPKNSAQALELTLRSDAGDTVYKGTFKPSEQPGIVSVTIPANSTALDADKDYSWNFSIVCDTRSRDKDVYVRGKIKRIEPDQNLALQLQQASPQQRATLYATAGYWQDTLETVADLRRKRPTDAAIKADWEDLLSSVQLDPQVINAPMIPCCTP